MLSKNYKYNIDAVHPVLKRVVKFNMSYEEMTKLYKELLDVGYEDKNINLTREEKRK